MKLLFSDLDGTILDFHTYSCEKSLPGISLCREHGIPLILVSSKTFDEMADIHCRLGLDAPFVFENGGGGVEEQLMRQRQSLRATVVRPYVRSVTGAPSLAAGCRGPCSDPPP
ncbi:MAG TPA: HAD hydrolase family protein [Spirochaetota bacterium]|nr:HAD hydrolase family protein [Spirochaetota bacterium]